MTNSKAWIPDLRADSRDSSCSVSSAKARTTTFVRAIAHKSIRPGEPEADFRGRTSLFGGFKIRGALDAYCYWTTDADPFADAFKFFEFCRGLTRPGTYVPLSAPAQWLCVSLATHQGAQTSLKAFDQFASSLGRWLRDPASADHTYARLMLYHPLGPSPDPKLNFLRSCAEQQWDKSIPFVDDLLNPTDIQRTNLLYWESLRAAQALHSAMRLSDARWILDLLFQKIPKRVLRGNLNAIPAADGIRLRRTTTANERASGIQVGGKAWMEMPPSARTLRGLGDV